MKPEAQRIAIAKWIKSRGGKLEIVISDFGAEYETLPDLDDLNVIHEIEKVLSKKQAVRFGQVLTKIVGGPMLPFFHNVVNATAAQRAEALLRTIGEWEDGK